MVKLSRIRTALIKGARPLRWPAAALAVGVIWSSAETLVIRTVFDSGFYFSRSLTSAFNGRVVFYGLVSVTVWALVMLGASAWRWVFGRDFSLDAAARRTITFWAAAAAWINLTIMAAYLFHDKLGVRPGNRFVLIALGAVPSLFALAALILFLNWLRRRFAAARAVLKSLGYAFLAAALALAATSYGYERFRSWSRPRPSGLPNVVFITLDAWRADAFRDDISPAIATFARENGLVFTNARAPSSWTLPSFAAIFTGSYNATRSNGVERRDDVRTTWAEVMGDNGYDTFAVFHNPFLDTIRFVNRGFTHLDYVRFNPFLRAIHFYDTAWYYAKRGQSFIPEAPGEANHVLTEKTLSVVRKGPNRPKFIWVHYLDPHYPYQPKADILREKAPHLSDKTNLGTDKGNLLPENAEAIKTLYECEVESTDREVARLLAEVATEPNTLVVISADHGEEFFEHGGTRHNRTVYDEVCKVPLIIALPKPDRTHVTVGETSSPVSLVDVAPSVLNYLGLPVPLSMEGRVDILSGEIPPDREVFVILNSPEYLTAALIVGDKKVIATLDRDDVRTEYYDLSADPGEQKPLPLDEEGKRLRTRLLGWLDERDVSREREDGGRDLFGDRADLRALGYM
ncbi:MAG: sulfatase [bacterium]